MVEQATATGLLFNDPSQPLRETAITVRLGKTVDFATLSLADDMRGIMIQVVLTPAVKKLLKKYIK